MAFVADPRTGEYLLWSDTAASLVRLFAGLGISTVIALVIGMLIGMLPYLRALLAPFVAVISMVPPLALLPILFIVMGLGETSKITLIVIGVAPIMIRDLALKVLELPREQIVKAETLGGSSWQIALRVVLPQILPRLITCLRLQLGPAWLFLIAAEAISSDSGLGYRIFLVRRYLSMDVIFPYVVWITLLAVLTNFILDRLRIAVFPWSELEKQAMSELVIDNVWKEYGDQIVLENVSLTDRRPRLRRAGRPLRLRQDDVPAHAARRGAADAGHHHARRQAAAARAGPGSRRRVPALFGVSASDRARQCAARQGILRPRASRARLFGAGPPRRHRGGAAADRRSRPYRRRRQISRRSFPAACSSGWRWRRR